MPCDAVVLQSVDFSAAKNHEDILAEALRALGYVVDIYGKQIQFSRNGVRGSFYNGQFRVGDGFDSTEVKRAFGKQAVKSAAKKYGWTVVEKDGRMKLQKRI